MKCLCPCPDYIKVPIEHGMTQTVLLKGFGTVLHGKKATTECERCGTPLCGDCADIQVNWEYMPNEGMSGIIVLCPVCEELTQ